MNVINYQITFRIHTHNVHCIDANVPIRTDRFFLPTVKLKERELARYRNNISNKEPSLPNKASKHFEDMCGAHLRRAARAHGPRKIQARSIRRPEPNLERLAKVVLRLVEQRVANDDCN